MVNVRAQIKKNARDAMSGNWGKAVTAVLVVFCVNLLFAYLEQILYALFRISGYVDIGNTPALFLDDQVNISWLALGITAGMYVVKFVLMSPLLVGVTKWFYQVVEGKYPPFSVIFDYYASLRTFGKALGVQFQVSLRIALMGIVVLLPSTCLRIVLQYLPAAGSDSLSLMGAVLYLLTNLVTVLSWLFLGYLSLRYFLCFFLLAEKDEVPVKKILQTSVRTMREYKEEIFTLFLSFIPWLLLCALILPAFFIAPYLAATAALYGKIYISRLQSRREMDDTRVAQPIGRADETETREGQEVETD